jgi:hypothetical protein
MKQTIYIKGLEEPLVTTRGCLRQALFYGKLFIQCPLTGRWWPVDDIKCIEAVE